MADFRSNLRSTRASCGIWSVLVSRKSKVPFVKGGRKSRSEGVCPSLRYEHGSTHFNVSGKGLVQSIKRMKVSGKTHLFMGRLKEWWWITRPRCTPDWAARWSHFTKKLSTICLLASPDVWWKSWFWCCTSILPSNSGNSPLIVDFISYLLFWRSIQMTQILLQILRLMALVSGTF